MSRVGKNPVSIPDAVEAKIENGCLHVKGKKGEENIPLLDHVTCALEGNQFIVTPNSKSKRARQCWGTMRALAQNAVMGVSEGHVRRLEINGVGYRAQVQGSTLKLQLGYSHDINFAIPSDLKAEIEGERGNIIAISGSSKQRVGQIASNIRSLRSPEPYKGKGVKYLEEVILRKEGKKK